MCTTMAPWEKTRTSREKEVAQKQRLRGIDQISGKSANNCWMNKWSSQGDVKCLPRRKRSEGKKKRLEDRKNDLWVVAFGAEAAA